MTALSRRNFLGLTGALAGGWLLSRDQLGRVLAAPAQPNPAPTTLTQTLRAGTPTRNQWRPIVTRAGEPYVARLDILRGKPAAARAGSRRSLLYLGHLTDIHIIDAQSPGRLEPLAELSEELVDATRPHETMTVQVLAAMVKSVTASALSPLTGAPMALALNSGDSADSMSALELRWCINTLDGVTVTPNSGGAQYEGVQIWPNEYAYQPADPALNAYGPYGFPQLPDLLNKAVSQPVTSPGLPVPWYVVYGNHDSLFMGNIAPSPQLQSQAVGDRKNVTWPAASQDLVGGYAGAPTAWSRFNEFVRGFGQEPGTRAVTADSRRTMFDQQQFMAEHLDSPANPGPVGHGFTSANLTSGKTYWRADPTPFFTVLGLDSCSQVTGADGAIPQDQFDWLKGELAQAQAANRLCAVVSHHNSQTLENPAEPTIGPQQRLIHAEEFIATLQEFPNLILWINGHTHVNTIVAHPRSDGGGFWEVTTASCVDFPQQQQLIEVVDNQDGTLSIFATTIDHLSDPAWREGDYSPDALPSLSRELALNSWKFTPQVRLGSALDRNTELLLPAPFDLSEISDRALDRAQMQAKARLLANGAIQ